MPIMIAGKGPTGCVIELIPIMIVMNGCIEYIIKLILIMTAGKGSTECATIPVSVTYNDSLNGLTECITIPKTYNNSWERFY